jgi:glycerol-3-phosphate O-acyltransferase
MDEQEQAVKQRLREVEREIRAKGKELEALEARLREEYEPQFQELIRYARRRGHTWLERRLLMMFDPSYPGSSAGRISDAERVDWFVQAVTAHELDDFEQEMIGPLESERSKLRKELRKAKKLREALDTLGRRK